MRKNFNDIDIFSGIKSSDGAKWQKDNNITGETGLHQGRP